MGASDAMHPADAAADIKQGIDGDNYDTGQQLMVSYIKLYPQNPPTNGLIIWLVVKPTPLKNDGLRQLGWLFSMEKLKTFQSTNQYSIIMWRLRS